MDKFDRFTIREALAILGLSSLPEFRRLKFRFGTDDFPKLESDTFDKAAILNLRDRLLANPGTSTQPPAPSTPTHDRRSGLADRRRRT